MNTSSTGTGIRTHVVDAIALVAPDVADEVATIADDVDVFEEFGLDSMDRLNIMTALVDATGVDISEQAYSQLTTVGELVDLLS